MIVATLAKNNGEVTAAAREMQVSRTTMWRLMKKHGISAEDTKGLIDQVGNSRKKLTTAAKVLKRKTSKKSKKASKKTAKKARKSKG